jgi:hypothetical protein
MFGGASRRSGRVTGSYVIDKCIELGYELLRVRLRAYKPESPPIGGVYYSIGCFYLKIGMLHEAE